MSDRLPFVQIKQLVTTCIATAPPEQISTLEAAFLKLRTITEGLYLCSEKPRNGRCAVGSDNVGRTLLHSVIHSEANRVTS